MGTINHADEWATEAKMERLYGVNWEDHITPAPDTVCQQCPYQHRPRKEKPCAGCEDNPDPDRCVVCPGHQAHSDAPPCEFPDGTACEHCRIGGTVPQAEALARWMVGR